MANGLVPLDDTNGAQACFRNLVILQEGVIRSDAYSTENSVEALGYHTRNLVPIEGAELVWVALLGCRFRFRNDTLYLSWPTVMLFSIFDEFRVLTLPRVARFAVSSIAAVGRRSPSLGRNGSWRRARRVRAFALLGFDRTVLCFVFTASAVLASPRGECAMMVPAPGSPVASLFWILPELAGLRLHRGFALGGGFQVPARGPGRRCGPWGLLSSLSVVRVFPTTIPGAFSAVIAGALDVPLRR